MTRVVGVAAIQSSAVSFDKNRTIAKVIDLIKKASDRGAEYVCTVELFNREFFPGKDVNVDWYDFAEEIPGETTNAISEAAKENKIYVMASVYEKTKVPTLNFNTLVLIGPDGRIIGKYRKVHIPMIVLEDIDKISHVNYEKFYYAPGDLGFPVFQTDKMRLGMAICYDRSFPETWRCLALNGAEVVFLSVSSKGFRKEYYHIELRTHAYESGIFIVAPNRVGKEGEINFYGSSVIVDPFGVIITSGGTEHDEVVFANIDLDMVIEARKRLTYFRDRRPELYHDIIKLDKFG